MPLGRAENRYIQVQVAEDREPNRADLKACLKPNTHVVMGGHGTSLAKHITDSRRRHVRCW
jgi:RNase P/RNase MRP subunit POP5